MNEKLLHGDCLKLMKEIPSGSVDLILCDPPYGKTNAKWDQPLLMNKVWKEYERIIKDHGCIAIFSMDPFASHIRISNEKMYRYDWIWKKAPTLPFMAHKRPMNAYENIMIFYKHLPTYNPQMWVGKNWGHSKVLHPGATRSRDNALSSIGIKHKKGYREKNTNKHFPVNIVRFSNKTNQYVKSYHPTQKPVSLLKYLIRTYTNPNDLVLDNCMGGGSTGVACKLLDRDFIGMELDSYYFKVAKDRIQNTKVKVTQ